MRMVFLFNLIRKTLRLTTEQEIAVFPIRSIVVKLLTGVLKEEELVLRWLFSDEKIFPRIKLTQLHMLPVIKTGATDGLLGNVEAIGFDENEFEIEGDASAPDAPSVTGNFGRK